MTKNMMIVGVGGQGSLLASKLIGHLLLRQGFDVKVSEVHGMSQRGGSVVTYVRWGDKVYSPIVDKGEADYIVSFEQLEAARWLEYLKKGGIVEISGTNKPGYVITLSFTTESGYEAAFETLHFETVPISLLPAKTDTDATTGATPISFSAPEA